MEWTRRRAGVAITPLFGFWLLISCANEAATEDPTDGPVWPEPPVELLILGTFHFTDAGLDNYRPQYDVDILSPDRQVEVEELLSLLEAFRPHKIAVEQLPSQQSTLDSLYSSYRAGEFDLPSNEIYQLGFRLAGRLGHERLHAVDAERRFYLPYLDPDEYAAAHGQDLFTDSASVELYNDYHQYKDELKTRQSLREHLIWLNHPEQVLRSHGQYLIDNFAVGSDSEYPGVDSRTAWYNRNLRIFANLRRLSDMEGDRVLLIIGNGHVPILRHATEASPQFEVVEVDDVL